MMQERVVQAKNGWVMLAFIGIFLILAPIAVWTLLLFSHIPFVYAAAAFVVLLFGIVLFTGLFTLQPNEARVLVLFGKYVGTVKEEGLHWANPFSVHRTAMGMAKNNRNSEQSSHSSGYKVSLRARNFETQVLKVNDQRGNPIEISAVIVWRVDNTAKALFDVDDYEDYVKIQSETALRHLANSYPYDHANEDEHDELTLRDDTDVTSVTLKNELQARLADAGVVVSEARLTHLAYSPEIASVMLRRQQAEAIISARQKIVHGAVSMVEMALNSLDEKGVVTFDEDKKANMVGNLLLVLCGESQAEPVINAGLNSNKA